MDGYMNYYMFNGHGYPYAGWIWMAVFRIVQLVIAFFIYRDAKENETNPILWFVLVIIPVIGWLFLVLYVILRVLDTGKGSSGQESSHKSAREILDERFAAGGITTDEYNAMKEELSR